MAERRKSKGPKPKYTPEQVADAIQQTNGLLTLAASKLGVSRSLVSYYVANTAECAEAAEVAIEGVKDLAEAKLYNAINNGAAWAICFFLKCRAKDRGYIERVEQTEEKKYTVEHKIKIEDLSDVEQDQYRELLARLIERGEARTRTGGEIPSPP